MPKKMPDKRPGFRFAALLGVSILALGLIIAVAEGVYLVQRTAALGSVWAWLVTVVGGLAAVAGVGLIWREWRGWARVRCVDALRTRLQEVTVLDDALDVAVSRWRAQLDGPQEALQDFDRHWLAGTPEDSLCALHRLVQTLDRMCESEIRREAARTGVLVTLSGVALFDAALCCWRNLRLMRRVAECYGARPGFCGTWRLCRMVLTHAIAVDLTQHAADAVSTRVGAVATAGGQGLVAATLTVRLGLWTQSVCRPLSRSPRTIGTFIVASAADNLGHRVRRTIRRCVGAIKARQPSTVAK